VPEVSNPHSPRSRLAVSAAPLAVRGLAVCALASVLGCTPGQQPAQLEGGTLLVRSGRAGVVRVGERLAEVTPFGPTRIFGVGDGPYALRFERADEVLLVRGVPGPAVDLRPLQEAEAPPVGQPISLSVTTLAGPGAEVRGVAVIGDQRVPGEADPDGLRFEVPGSGELTVLVGWYRDGRLQALDRLELPSARGYSGVVARPRHVADGTLVVDVRGDRPGWVAAELTVNGVRTGLPLGAGLAGGRVGVDVGQAIAVGLPRPTAPDLADLGIWVQTSTRQVGATHALATVGEHLDVGTTTHAVALPSALATLPVPARYPEGATVLPRDASLVTSLNPSATYVQARLVARNACEAVRWQVVDGPFGAIDLQTDAAGSAGDLSGAPLLSGTFSEVTLGDTLDVGGVVSETGPRPHLWPRFGGKVSVRTVSGHLSGLAPACSPADPRRGRYAVQRADGGCAPGRRAPEVLLDGCGRIIPVAEGDGAVAELCGLAGDLLDAADAEGRLPVRGGDVARWLVPIERLAARPPPTLTGGWYRAEVVESQRGPDVGAQPGPLLGSPATLFVGEPAEGPFFEVTGDGEASLDAGPLRWVGRFDRVDSTGGTLHLDAPACLEERRTVTATAAGDDLVLEERVAAPDRVRIRTVRLSRR
jgi:hypothetical protein